MSKAKINNEIILLRKNVVQARVHVIKKLTRDILKLRKKKGTEAQQAQNLRKAERLTAEILAIKKAKKDDITKFSLTNTLSLIEILQNQKSVPLTRAMARIANHNKFSAKILELKNKYPNYTEFLGPGRKKKTKLEQKEQKKVQNNKNIENLNSDSIVTMGKTNTKDEDSIENSETDLSANEMDEDENEIKAEDGMQSEDENISECEQNDNDNQDVKENGDHQLSKSGGIQNTKRKEKLKKDKEKEISKKRSKEHEKLNEITVSKKLKINNEDKNSKDTVEEKSTKSLRKNRKNKDKDIDKPSKDSKSKTNTETLKIISKEAIVKKFTDVLKDEDGEIDKIDKNQKIDSNKNKSNIKIEKQVDPFFVTEDGETNYLSIVLPKKNLEDVEDHYEDNHKFNKRNFSRQQNNQFFSKVPKFKNNTTKFNPNNAEQRWTNHQQNGQFNQNGKDRKNSDFKKFNNDYRDKSISSKKHSKASIEDKSNEFLHPSWEAKKKQQEILKKGFQGKKIVFNDDV